MEARRVKVCRSGQSLMLRVPDLSVARLASVFKVKPQSLFLEEESSKNVEFPEDGHFHLVDVGPGNKYIVCGDDESCEDPPPFRSSQPGPSSASLSVTGWTIPRPWSQSVTNPAMEKVNPLSRAKRTPMPASNSATLKRTFPYVSLCLDHTGKNVTVESTIDSIYVKLPENAVCVSSVLEEVSARVGFPAEDLILLDSKFVPVSNDERDMEYWKVPSRRFYIAARTEFQNLRRTRGKALTLSRKRRRDLPHEEEDSGEESVGLGRVAQELETVVKEVADIKCDLTAIKNLQCNFDDARRLARMELARDQLRLLECKICRDTPSSPIVLVTCCKQVLGCATCYQSCMEQSECCPLCRDPDTHSIVVEGLDALYTFLKDNVDGQ